MISIMATIQPSGAGEEADALPAARSLEFVMHQGATAVDLLALPEAKRRRTTGDNIGAGASNEFTALNPKPVVLFLAAAGESLSVYNDQQALVDTVPQEIQVALAAVAAGQAEGQQLEVGSRGLAGSAAHAQTRPVVPRAD